MSMSDYVDAFNFEVDEETEAETGNGEQTIINPLLVSGGLNLES